MDSKAQAEFDKKAQAIFFKFDKNENGMLEFAELKAALSCMCVDLTPSQLNTLISVYGYSSESEVEVDVSQFLNLALQAQSMQASRDEVKAAFEVLDLNHDRKISKEEFMEFLGISSGSPDAIALEMLVNACDADQDGTLNVDEFAEYCLNTREGCAMAEYSVHPSDFVDSNSSA
mmetsp:Transcript_29262/g.57463  ORF Transcript_29262/g.57463 Transcript_29262/m.57463 type:complete len:175 (+) Transcript_29262:62-586(+)|eukprot:CAMPEP_0175143498 /NCGR_PEP_ID=MMETSP0087-20121206/13474_1 /TAXON_ID=136419 /ORGANISM="Unknown Unknown, Strain D1" /LENGTH=174 /DNA_ID=CAMNT_0016427591 /DNA_START=60 /DNA_END=584 /DNA_ORIENTATION=+